ncbi:hypothetical protein GW813_06730, partial [bacterium]|nr:hypothetical protein [bacterium]
MKRFSLIMLALLAALSLASTSVLAGDGHCTKVAGDKSACAASAGDK